MDTTVSLRQRAKRWKDALKQADTGPLIVASEVCSVVDDWERYEQEAKGLNCDAWLKKVFGGGRGTAWFIRRRDAVKLLGEACRRTIHHEVAVWLVNKRLNKTKLEEVKAMLMRECAANGRNPLSPGMAKQRIFQLIGKPHKRTRLCMRCQMLEELLRDNGIDVP